MRAKLRLMPLGDDRLDPHALEKLVGATPLVQYPDGSTGEAVVHGAEVVDGWLVVDVELDQAVELVAGTWSP